MLDRRIRRKQTAGVSNVGAGGALREICNRNFNVVTLINLLVMTAYYLIFVTSTSYAREAYLASLSTAGFTAGIMVIGCLAGRFVTGNLLSFFGCRAVLLAGIVLYTARVFSWWIPCPGCSCNASGRASASASSARPREPLWPM